MGNIADTKISRRTESGKRIEYSFKTTVSAKGEFRIKLAPELSLTAQSFKPTNDSKVWGADSKHGRVKVDYYVVHSFSLADAVQTANQIVDLYATETSTDELVILYRWDSTCVYFLDSDGSVRPNVYESREEAEADAGDEEDDDDKPAEVKSKARYVNLRTSHGWHETPVGSITLQAEAAKKTTYVSNGVVTGTVYNEPYKNFDNGSDWGARLNSYLGISLSKSGGMSRIKNALEDGVREMPYSENAAKIFYEAMFSMVQISERMRLMLADKERFEAALASGNRLLLGGLDE